jgi:hypothetical protein
MKIRQRFLENSLNELVNFHSILHSELQTRQLKHNYIDLAVTIYLSADSQREGSEK